MAGRKRVNTALVSMLQDLLDMAKDGEVVRLFAVIGYFDGFFTHDYATDDADDLILQVRTEVIRAQTENAVASEPTAH
jgi:hypothetical protein